MEICLTIVVLCCSATFMNCAPRPELGNSLADRHRQHAHKSPEHNKPDTVKLMSLLRQKRNAELSAERMLGNMIETPKTNRAERSTTHQWMNSPPMSLHKPPMPNMPMHNMLMMPAWNGNNLSINQINKLIEALSTIRHFLIVQKQAIVHEGGRGLVPTSFKRNGERLPGQTDLSGQGHHEARRAGPEFATNGW